MAGIVAVGVEVLRLPDDLLLALPTWFIWSRRTLLQRPWLPRMTVIPIPGLRARLERWLMYDWSAGVHDVNQILVYSLQCIPAVAAVNRAMVRLLAAQIIPAAAELTRDPFKGLSEHPGCTEGDPGTRDMEHGQVMLDLLLPANRRPSEAIQPGAGPLDDPTPRPITIPMDAFLCLGFRTAGADVDCVAPWPPPTP